MKLRTCALLVAAGCGGKAATAKDVSNVTDDVPADGLRRPDVTACPDDALEALAPGWEELDDWTTPGVDACVRGRFPAEGVLVYASSQPDADSQTEVGWPARRVVFDAGGKIVLEGPGDGGDWMFGPATPIGTIDLNGDGTDEVLEDVMLDPVTSGIDILGMVDGAMIVIGTYVLELGDGDYTCKGAWSIGPMSPHGARPLVLSYQETGEAPEVDPYLPPEDQRGCPGAGEHHLTIGPDGMLVDDFVDPDEEDDEDGEGEEGEGDES